MGLKRQILRPVAFLAGLHANRQVKAFLRAHEDTEGVQQRLLRELVAHHRESAFGRDHDFASIRTVEDFRQAVPVGSYLSQRTYMDRVYAGDTRALLAPGEDVLMFSRTSGTTGKPKYIPVTRRFLSSIRRGWNIWGIRSLQDHPAAWLRKIVQITSTMREHDSPRGAPCGAISGLLAHTQKRIVRRMYPVPREVGTIHDPNVKYYLILRCAAQQDVAFITTANPSSTIKLAEIAEQNGERLVRDIRDGAVRPPGPLPKALGDRLRFRPDPATARRLDAGADADGALRPRHMWDLSFLANWTGGTLKLYLPRLAELFDHIPVRDIGLVASEGRFSIPLAADTPAGVAEIQGNYLEFIPAEHHAQAHPPVLAAHEVEVGREYFLVITNWAGLWRYDMDDRVLVTGKLAQSPVFEFLSRGEHTANITGEKITEHQVVEAMRRASLEVGVSVERFVVQGRFAKRPYYELRLEHPDGADVDLLARRMDRALCELNIEYHSKRDGERLDSIRPVVLPEGQLQQAEDQAIEDRMGRTEQYKHTYLRTDVQAKGDEGGGSPAAPA